MTPAANVAPRSDLARATDLAYLYRAPVDKPVLIDVPPLNALWIDGRGAPAETAFQAALQALYSLTYTIKFGRRKLGLESGYRVMPLEGLWSTDASGGFEPSSGAPVSWTLFIVQPEYVNGMDVRRALAELDARGKRTAAVERVRLLTFSEGRAAQIMHVGPYSAEAPTIARLHAFIRGGGLRRAGRHHEIYLGDPRRADPSRLRTILRQPVASRG